MKKRTVVIGLGRSGIGAAKLLHSEGNEVIVFEACSNNELIETSKKLQKQGIKVLLGEPLEIKSFSPWLENLSSIVISPGIPWNHPTLESLRKKGVKVEGEITVAWERLKSIPWIGITGTNGKTTVTHMLHHVLKENQLRVLMGGNEGHAASEIALECKKNKETPDWLIMELSSYQLEGESQIKPEIGIWTNLTPDHLERHGTFDAYGKIKNNLMERSSKRIYNRDDQFLSSRRLSLKEGCWVSTQKRDNQKPVIEYWIDERGMIHEKNAELFQSSVLPIKGQHNLENLLLVIAAARTVGISQEQIKASISSFKGVKHRLENIGLLEGVEVFNDSKATNYESSSIALKSLGEKTILIAGGQMKKGDSTEWIKTLKRKTSGIILIGESASVLSQMIKESNYKESIKCCIELEEAVDIAMKLSKKKKAKYLLLSPACASFDQYKDFEDRGNHFKQIISKLQSKSNETAN